MTYFIDLHVLGQDPKHIRTALSAWRKDAKKSLATGDGDVVGKAAETKPAQAPFPAVGMVGVAGAAFDHNALADADETIERLAKKAAVSLGVQAVVAVWWRLDGESVKFTAINADGQVERRFLEDGEAMESALGQSLQDALADDDALDGIGDKLLPVFMDPAPEPLKGLFALQRQDALDATLEPGRKPRSNPRF